MNNKRLGNSFEKEYEEILKSKGYWVTFLTPKAHVGSQPADLIAVKNDEAMLVDCKTCGTRFFPIARIEANQRQAFKRFYRCGNRKFILAIKYNNKIYEINMKEIDFTQKSIDLEGRTNENSCVEYNSSDRSG